MSEDFRSGWAGTTRRLRKWLYGGRRVDVALDRRDKKGNTQMTDNKKQPHGSNHKTEKKPEAPESNAPTAQKPDAPQTPNALGMAIGGLLAPMCAVCPKFERGWCVHLATTRPPDAPSCEWGRRKMNSAHAAEYKRRKFGWKKREAKPEQGQETEEEECS